MRNTYNLTIGEQSAERSKLEIGTATTAAIGSLASPTIEVRGRDNVSGMPRAVTVTSEEICQGSRRACSSNHGRRQANFGALRARVGR